MTSTLTLCLQQLRELVMGGAEKNVTLTHIDQLLSQLHAHQDHSTIKIEHLQKDLQNSKKEAKTLKKENSILKATISNQKSDLDMMDIKNKKLHNDLMKFQQKEHKQERKEDRKGLK